MRGCLGRAMFAPVDEKSIVCSAEDGLGALWRRAVAQKTGLHSGGQHDHRAP